ncbi:MAG: hypothetical protein ABIB43_04240 [archaeon]
MTSKEQVFMFKKSADRIFKSSDFTSATIIYFKTLFAIHDFILLQKIGYAPKDHTERFRLLEKEFPESYKIIDSEFNTYRSTYSRIISEETCKRIKKLVENEIEHYEI